MPPRYAYWTILAGGLPTAFRTTDRDELLPTFKQIQRTHPDAEMKYFARGKLWTSPEEARADAEAARARPKRAVGRGRDWRPGGEHRDPRQKFKDAQQARNRDRRAERFERRPAKPVAPSGDAARRPAPPAGDAVRRPAPPSGDAVRRPAKPAGAFVRRPARPTGNAVRRPAKPHGDPLKPRPAPPRGPQRPPPPRPKGPRRRS